MHILIKEALSRTGKPKTGLAKVLGVSGSAITELLKGKRAIKAGEVPKIVAYLELDKVRIVGRVGHGGAVEPVPPDTDEHVQLPMVAPDVMQAYEIAGDGMMPRYDAGDAVVVWSEQKHKTPANYLGQEAVVRGADGKTWLRYLERGPGSSVILHTFNARPVEVKRIDWVGEVYLTVRGHQRRKRQRR